MAMKDRILTGEDPPTQLNCKLIKFHYDRTSFPIVKNCAVTIFSLLLLYLTIHIHYLAFSLVSYSKVVS